MSGHPNPYVSGEIVRRAKAVAELPPLPKTPIQARRLAMTPKPAVPGGTPVALLLQPVGENRIGFDQAVEHPLCATVIPELGRQLIEGILERAFVGHRNTLYMKEAISPDKRSVARRIGKMAPRCPFLTYTHCRGNLTGTQWVHVHDGTAPDAMRRRVRIGEPEYGELPISPDYCRTPRGRLRRSPETRPDERSRSASTGRGNEPARYGERLPADGPGPRFRPDRLPLQLVHRQTDGLAQNAAGEGGAHQIVRGRSRQPRRAEDLQTDRAVRHSPGRGCHRAGTPCGGVMTPVAALRQPQVFLKSLVAAT